MSGGAEVLAMRVAQTEKANRVRAGLGICAVFPAVTVVLVKVQSRLAHSPTFAGVGLTATRAPVRACLRPTRIE